MRFLEIVRLSRIFVKWLRTLSVEFSKNKIEYTEYRSLNVRHAMRTCTQTPLTPRSTQNGSFSYNLHTPRLPTHKTGGTVYIFWLRSEGKATFRLTFQEKETIKGEVEECGHFICWVRRRKGFERKHGTAQDEKVALFGCSRATRLVNTRVFHDWVWKNLQ